MGDTGALGLERVEVQKFDFLRTPHFPEVVSLVFIKSDTWGSVTPLLEGVVLLSLVPPQMRPLSAFCCFYTAPHIVVYILVLSPGVSWGKGVLLCSHTSFHEYKR